MLGDDRVMPRALTVLAVVACTGLSCRSLPGGGEEEEAAVVGSEVGAAQACPVEILDDPTRSDEDRVRDAESKPLEVYCWLGIESGMTIFEIVPTRGYNTHLLSRLVGSGGKVWVAPGPPTPALAERIRSADLSNVEFVGEFSDVPTGTVDAIITVRNFHEFYIFDFDTDEVLQQMLDALRPGGVLGVVDVRTEIDDVDRLAHRIRPEFVINELTDAGFIFEDSSELLRAVDDDHRLHGAQGRWDLTRNDEDRMLLKFKKPK